MEITEFLNPYDLEHVKAYSEMLNTGYWPTGFYHKYLVDMEFPWDWQIAINYKMAKLWLEVVLSTEETSE
ncbi:MAG: hypothetical protein ACTSXY_16400 [Promethearchaeota archaeon]